MARHVRDENLSSATSRLKLKARGKPYYRSIEPGLHLGYRRGKSGAVWVMRAYLGQQAYRVEAIGKAADKDDQKADGVAFLDFKQAQDAARALYIEITRQAKGLPTKAGPYTVRDAIDDYLAWMEQHRKSGRDTRYAAERFILPKLGDTDASKLTAPQIRKWLAGIADSKPLLRSGKGDTKMKHRAVDMKDPEVKRQRRATANRILTTLKAALNKAWREKRIPSDDEWRMVQPYPDVAAARLRYLSTAECSRLVNASPEGFREMVQAALLTGCRYGELTLLTVDAFNPDSGTVAVRTSKTGKPRHVVLTEEGVRFFTRLAAGKAGDDLLLRRSDGTEWTKSAQARPMREACKVAKIKPLISFHGLRHTWASHAVMNGAPLLVVAKNLGHADTRMVERHYGHLAPSFIADQIRANAPKFGFTFDNVAPLRGSS